MRINTEKLIKGLKLVEKAMAKDLGIICNLSADKLILNSNNGEVKIRTVIDIEDGEERDFILDKIAVGVLKLLPSGTATIKFEENKAEVKVLKIKNNLVLPEYKGEAETEDPKVIAKFTITNETLLKIKNIGYATATDDSRPILQGIYFNCNKGQVESLDGFRAAIHKLPEIVATGEENTNFILKGTNLSYIDLDDSIHVKNKSRWVEFSSKETTISIAKMDGEFIDTERLFNKGDKIAYLSPAELMGVLKRNIIITDKDPAAFIIKDKHITVVGGTNTNKMEQELEYATVNFDDEIVIWFNCTYLYECMDSFNKLSKEDVKVHFNSNKKQPIILEIDGTAALVLPVSKNEGV